MAKAKVFHGARAKLVVDGKVVGLFSNCSWGVAYDSHAIHILGRFSPAEIVLTGQDAINVSATGFRLIDNGPHIDAKVPKLQDLLNHEDISLSLIDRQTGKNILNIVGVRPTGYSSNVSSRGITEMTVNFMGTIASDESGTQGEGGAGDGSASVLP